MSTSSSVRVPWVFASAVIRARGRPTRRSEGSRAGTPGAARSSPRLGDAVRLSSLTAAALVWYGRGTFFSRAARAV